MLALRGAGVDARAAECVLRDGVLHITLPPRAGDPPPAPRSKPLVVPVRDGDGEPQPML